MSARVLVVDDIPANVKILEAKLKASYYTVLTAFNGIEALEIAKAEKPDLILLDVMMPEMDGFECCRRLKADPALSHIPVVMVTALDQPSARVQGLESGADDFLTKPPNDLALFARVRSLVRVKMMIDELRARDDTFREVGGDDIVSGGVQTFTPEGRVLVVDSLASRAATVETVLSERLPVSVEVASTRDAALAAVARGPVDLFIVSNRLEGGDGLRFCSELRSAPDTRQSAIVVVVEDGAFETIASALDLGASDYIMRPIDENELVARARAQLMRKNYADRLRADMHASLKMAVSDGLTGLYNRRYVDQHLARQLSRSGGPVSLLMLDIDRFKSINDSYGHAAGDAVLVEIAQRLRDVVRSFDLVARYGGEEFMIVMPETDEVEARAAGERVREMIGDAPFAIGGAADQLLRVTVSVGVAQHDLAAGETPRELVERADQALYRSKNGGRNCVTLAPLATPTVDVA